MIDIPDFVYPKDANGNPLCPKCYKAINQCDCPSFEPAKPKAQPIKPKIRLEKSARAGKTVTVIDGLPANEAYLKNLAKELKVKTGSGGTFYVAEGIGAVEIQGDHRKLLLKHFD